MIKLFSFLCFYLCFLTGYAQEIFPYNESIYYTSNKLKGTSYFSNKVSTVNYVILQSKNRKQSAKKTIIINKKGHYTDFIKLNVNNKISSSWHYTYLNDTLLITTCSKNKKGDTIYKSINSYNELMKVVEKDNYFNKMERPKNHETLTYTGIGELSSDAFYGSNGRLFYRYEYDYFDTGKKKETRYFNQKNKLKYKYTYVCDPKGEVQKKEVKEVNYCMKKSVNTDGTFFEIFENKDEKSRITKTIYTYSADSNLVQTEVFNYKGELRNKSTFTYDEKGMMKSFNNYKTNGDLKSAWQYTYNDNGLVQKQVKLNCKNMPIEEINYLYTYYN